MAERDELYAINLGRVDFTPGDFDKFVYQHGAKALWERSMLCSCISESSGQPDFTCPNCDGKGFSYDEGKVIKALINNADGKKDSVPVGLLDVGTTLATISSEFRVGFRDRLLFPDMRTVYSQVLTYKGNPAGERLKYYCAEMQQVRVLDTKIPEDKYEVNGSRIIFKEDAGIQVGERFSVLMYTIPSYIVIDIPHELRGTFVKMGRVTDTWEELPKQYMIKREDLLPATRGGNLLETN
ncbi:hypothetical protein ACSHUI_00825 [Bacillus subtilis]|uniref:hypothetical protein n=1 Tax=Bacillus subtilis TaxID=1423 RepID=UPI003CEE8FFF